HLDVTGMAELNVLLSPGNNYQFLVDWDAADASVPPLSFPPNGPEETLDSDGKTPLTFMHEYNLLLLRALNINSITYSVEVRFDFDPNGGNGIQIFQGGQPVRFMQQGQLALPSSAA